MTSKFLIPKFQPDDSCSESSCNELYIRATPGRKRKLDHLTFEEKVQRKKLKNRVAAQTSRDRKKKQMEEMQETIEKQCEQISHLEHKCDQLASERDKILAKYEKLEKDYQKMKAKTSSRKETKHNIPEEHKYTRSALEETSVDSCVGSLSIKTEGSAESHTPLLKVTKMEIESTKRSTKVLSRKKSEVKALLKVIMLCLLYRSSSKISSSTNSTWSSLQKACSMMSRQTWKQLFHQASLQMPKAQAANSHCLNSWWGPKTQEWNPPKISAH